MKVSRTLAWVSCALLTVALSQSALAKKPRKKAPPAPVSTMDPTLAQQVQTTLEKATRSGDISARGGAYYGLALVQVEGSDPTPVLLDALKDPQGSVRLGAARGLLALGNPAWRDAFVALLGDPMVTLETDVLPAMAALPLDQQAGLFVDALNAKIPNKLRIASGLVTHGGPLLAEAVKQALAKGGDAPAALKQVLATLSPDRAALLYPIVLPVADAELKNVIVANLTRLPGDVDLSFLAPLLKDADQGVARKAALALAMQGNHDAVAVLLPMATSEQGPAQLSALRAIAQAATKADLPSLDAFLDPLNNTPPKVLGQVFGAYAHADARLTLEPHIKAALRSTDGDLRAAGVRFLGMIDGTSAVPSLAQYLVDGNVDVRQNAAWALGELRSLDGLPLLERALRDTSDDVRLEIVKALQKIPDNQVVNIVQFLVSDANKDIKLAAIQTLAKLKNISAVDSLRVALNDADPDVRVAALRAIIVTDLVQGRAAFNGAKGWLQPGDILGMTRVMGKDFLPYLQLALDAESAAVRTEALDALALLGPESQATLLDEVYAKSRFPDLKLLALAKLVRIRGEAMASQLTELVQDPNGTVEARILALRLLGDARAKSAEETLKAALNDASEQARVAAAIALLKLHRPDV